MIHHAGVANLAGISANTFVRHAIGIEAAAQSYSHADDDEVLHAMSRTVYLLAQCSHMRVIAYRNGNAQSVAQHGLQRNHPFPRQVGRILDTSGNNTCTRTADADAADGLIAAVSLRKAHHLFRETGYKLVDVRIK